MSITKTLAPRYPTGINMIGEVDIFYPLQTMIADYFPTTPSPPPEPEPEELPVAGVDAGGPEEAAPLPSTAAGTAPTNGPTIAATSGPTKPNSPTPILQDGGDNFNPQNHPGEIYVTGPTKSKRVGTGNAKSKERFRPPAIAYSQRKKYFWRTSNPNSYPVC